MKAFGVFIIILFSFFLVLPVVLADRGMIPIHADVSVYEPGQKAILAWDGGKEIMILSTDVYASKSSEILEILPLPSNPTVEEGNFNSFEYVQRLIQKHGYSLLRERGIFGKLAVPAEPGIEITFHKKIGAHDITVVKVNDIQEFIQWIKNFFESRGFEYEEFGSLDKIISDYIKNKINFFVFDLIEINQTKRSVKPIIYTFGSNELYYPLEISSIAKGETEINLFIITQDKPSLAKLTATTKLEPAYYYSFKKQIPVQFELTSKELKEISEEIGELFKNAYLTVVKYHGSIENLEGDLEVSYSYMQPSLIERFSDSISMIKESVNTLAKIFIYNLLSFFRII